MAMRWLLELSVRALQYVHLAVHREGSHRATAKPSSQVSRATHWRTSSDESLHRERQLARTAHLHPRESACCLPRDSRTRRFVAGGHRYTERSRGRIVLVAGGLRGGASGAMRQRIDTRCVAAPGAGSPFFSVGDSFCPREEDRIAPPADKNSTETVFPRTWFSTRLRWRTVRHLGNTVRAVPTRGRCRTVGWRHSIGGRIVSPSTSNCVGVGGENGVLPRCGEA